MAKIKEAYTDDRGNLHHSPESAIIADIAAALGRVGDEGGLTNGVAKLILDRREQIERAFADLDKLNEQNPNLVELKDHAKQWPRSA
ncbi:hypothetical protein GRI89_03180 [Altererythrobacter salegens]|uniref:Uncharacterized protein n=1 Tax=Croceibacterium salegens TaxID=1737568 RepID=A0A6I4SUQ9_9SPHN|nr:hypothetical protein [Croceibacterium salegens]MXO58546.1 hypothetical protein [Croceibacterium salegens]